MGGTCNTHVKIRNAKIEKEEACLGGLEVDGRTIINWV
jgi:hypothetical protein